VGAVNGTLAATDDLCDADFAFSAHKFRYR
jgi:hypothetical protein